MRRTLGLLLLLGTVLLTGCRMMSDEEIDAVGAKIAKVMESAL